MDEAGRMDLIRELCSFEGRRAGTDSERRAANRLAARLRESGRRATVEPTYVHPQYGLVIAAHCGRGFAGSLAAIAQPAVGFAIVLATAVSLYLDLNARFYLVRRLFFRRASQNVVSPGDRSDAPARLLICAHYDSAKSGALFEPKRVAHWSGIARRIGLPLSPFRVLFWSLGALLPILGARMAGIDSNAISVLQLPPTLILLAGSFLFVDVELSEVVPGANDNASGVATALGLADELDAERPESLDVWILLTGANECLMEGMRSFVASHRRELDRETTFFLVLDAVGRGRIRYETGAGLAVTFPMDARLAQLCEATATADREDGNRYDARPLRQAFPTDSLPPRLAKYRCTAITCLEGDSPLPPAYHRPEDVTERLDSAALDGARDFALALVRALDREVGRRAPPSRERPRARPRRGEMSSTG